MTALVVLAVLVDVGLRVHRLAPKPDPIAAAEPLLETKDHATKPVADPATEEPTTLSAPVSEGGEATEPAHSIDGVLVM